MCPQPRSQIDVQIFPEKPSTREPVRFFQEYSRRIPTAIIMKNPVTLMNSPPRPMPHRPRVSRTPERKKKSKIRIQTYSFKKHRIGHSVQQSPPHYPTTLAASALIYATISCIFVNPSGDKMSKSHCPPKKSGGKIRSALGRPTK